MNFGTVSESESASIMTILNANNFTTLGCVTEINGVPYLKTKSHYICYTSFVTRGQYQLFITGRLNDDRVERFRYYGKKFSNLPPCLPFSIPENKQDTEISDKDYEKLNEAFKIPWTYSVQLSKPFLKEATFPIYGFNHYVSYLQPCSDVPMSCHHYATNTTNTCDFCM